MAFLLLIIVGASAGWLASIIARTESSDEILRQLALGIATSLVVGGLTNSVSVLGGLSAVALGSAILAAAAMLTLYHVVLRDWLKT